MYPLAFCFGSRYLDSHCGPLGIESKRVDVIRGILLSHILGGAEGVSMCAGEGGGNAWIVAQNESRKVESSKSSVAQPQ